MTPHDNGMVSESDNVVLTQQDNVLLSEQDDVVLTQQDNVMLSEQNDVVLSEAEASETHPSSQPLHPKPGLGVELEAVRQAKGHMTSA